MKTLAQIFPTDPARYRHFPATLAATKLRVMLTPTFERNCQQAFAKLGFTPLPGLSASETMLYRLEQLRAPGVPPEVFSYVESATQGLFGTATDLQHAGAAMGNAFTEAAEEIMASPEAQVRAAEALIENDIRREGGDDPVKQLLALNMEAADRGVPVIEAAKAWGMTGSPGEAAAQMDRANEPPPSEAMKARHNVDWKEADQHLKEHGALQKILADPRWQAFAAQTIPRLAGLGGAWEVQQKPGESAGRALLNFLLPLTDTDFANKNRSSLDDQKLDADQHYERVAAGTRGALGDADAVRTMFERIRMARTNDQFQMRAMERDHRSGISTTPATPPGGDRRAALDAAYEKAARASSTPPRNTSHASTDRRFDLETSARKLSGESLRGVSADPKVRSEVIRRPAATLRQLAGHGEDGRQTPRDSLEHSWNRIQAVNEGRGEAFDAATDVALTQANELESAADEAARSAE